MIVGTKFQLTKSQQTDHFDFFGPNFPKKDIYSLKQKNHLFCKLLWSLIIIEKSAKNPSSRRDHKFAACNTSFH